MNNSTLLWIGVILNGTTLVALLGGFVRLGRYMQKVDDQERRLAIAEKRLSLIPVRSRE